MKKTEMTSESSGKEPYSKTEQGSSSSPKKKTQKKPAAFSRKSSRMSGDAASSEAKSSTSTESSKEVTKTPKLKSLRRQEENALFQTPEFLEGVLEAISIGATVRSAANSHGIRYSALQSRLHQADIIERYRAAQKASADSLAEKSQEFAERMIPPDGEKINPHTAKVVLEHLRWLAKVKDPNRYSDTQNINMNTRDLTKEHLEELRKINTKIINP